MVDCVDEFPLDKKQRIDQDTRREYPALHSHWVKPMHCVAFEPIPAMDKQADLDGWKQRCSFVIEDLELLLCMEHQQFWCQVLYDKTVVHKMVDSYLKHAPRWYDPCLQWTPEVTEIIRKLHRLIFLICLRMSTCKESSTEYITPSVFGDLIYDNFVFDIPRLLDICVLFGQHNSSLVSKMVENIFKNQHKYELDLQSTVSSCRDLLNSATADLGVKTLSSLLQEFPDEPKPIAQTSSENYNSKTDNVSYQLFLDKLRFIRDTTETFFSFISLFPACATICLEATFDRTFIHLYESLIPRCKHMIHKVSYPNEETSTMAKNLIFRIHNLVIRIVHSIWHYGFLERFLESKDTKVNDDYSLDSYYHNLTEVMFCKRFIAAYHLVHPFEQTYQELANNFLYDMDTALIGYASESVRESLKEFGVFKPLNEPEPEPETNGAPASGAYVNSGFDPYDDEPTTCPKPCTEAQEAETPEDVQLISLISAVKDLFPDLGDGFVQACLRHFNFESERVVNALLEDTLPPALNSLDRNLLLQPEAHLVKPLLLERRNVFAGDELDFTQPQGIDKESLRDRVFQGKREKTGSEQLSTVDKSVISKKYAVIVEDCIEDVETEEGVNADPITDYCFSLYEDEYDDTYDSHIPAKEIDPDWMKRRAFVTPIALGGDGRPSESSSEDEEIDNQAQSGPGRGRGLAPQRQYDVRGGRKGQGQTQEVLHNRQFKDRHKGQRANHNRRYLSDKKHRGGMF